MITYKVLCIEDKTIQHWTLESILDEINKDRSSKWTDYNQTDWIEGWMEWVDGESYKLIGETPITISESKVTGADVLNWHGSDHSIEELADVLAEILNGTYELSLAKEEIGNH